MGGRVAGSLLRLTVSSVSTVRRLVVVGGGAAGMSAASAARRVDPALEIVVLEATGYVAYGLCGIPYYLAGLVERADELIAHPAAYFAERRRLDLRTHAEVTALDPDRGRVSYRQAGRHRTLGYDALVVAAGGVPGAVALSGVPRDRVFTIRTLEDAITLRTLLDAGRVGRALVVGAGYIGLEMAEALVARGCAVTVVERLDRVLTSLDEEVAATVEAHVREHVDLRLSTGLDSAEWGERSTSSRTSSCSPPVCGRRRPSRRLPARTPARPVPCSSTTGCARACPGSGRRATASRPTTESSGGRRTCRWARPRTGPAGSRAPWPRAARRASRAWSGPRWSRCSTWRSRAPG